MGKSVVLHGGDGMGQHTKLANQIAIAGAISGVAEALSYARAAGLDLGMVLSTVSAGSGASWQLANNGPKMIAGDWAPGFYVKHFLKDLRLASQGAQKAGLRLKVLDAAHEAYAAMEAGGMGDLGTQALIRQYGDEGGPG
jgi:3-hydroxyisobutyrate dehydrogenase/2-hydroxy-3-oxopropionate reductase